MLRAIGDSSRLLSGHNGCARIYKKGPLERTHHKGEMVKIPSAGVKAKCGEKK
jgi:hypothetical protein